MKAGSVQGKVRDNHIVKDDVTSRDLLGFVRGRCSGCASCGKYIIYTKEKYYKKGGDTHPDCDTTMMNCSRCDCPADLHEVDEVENERERGNDAFSLKDYDKAICHYTRAIELNNVDWRLWSNRSRCYSAKKWYSQALSDAERACLLDDSNFKVWYRKSIALKGLSKCTEALTSIEISLNCLKMEESPKPEDIKAIESLKRDLIQFLRRSQGQGHLQPKSGRQKSRTEPHSREESIKSDVYRDDTLNQLVLQLQSSIFALSESQKQQFQDISLRLDRIESLLEECQCRNYDGHYNGATNPRQVFFSKEDDCADDASPPTGSDYSDCAESLHDPCSDEDSSLEMDACLHAPCHDSSISRTSSSESSFLEEIESIQNAWKAKVGSSYKGLEDDVKLLDVDLHQQKASHDEQNRCCKQKENFDAKVTRNLSSDYKERMARIKKAEERISGADNSVEPLSSTDIDSLTQQKRGSCANCGINCPGFKIFFTQIDVNDPEVMFYCSLCGCRSEDHIVDPLWQSQEYLRRQKEDQDAKIRAERLKSRRSRFPDSSAKREEAFAVLNLQSGTDKSEIKAAYKLLAKKFHPDKQKDKSNKDDISYRQQPFTKATDAYKFLMENH